MLRVVMLNATYRPSMLSVVMLNVVMLSFVAPFLQLQITLVNRLQQRKGPKLKTIYNRNLH